MIRRVFLTCAVVVAATAGGGYGSELWAQSSQASAKAKDAKDSKDAAKAQADAAKAQAEAAAKAKKEADDKAKKAQEEKAKAEADKLEAQKKQAEKDAAAAAAQAKAEAAAQEAARQAAAKRAAEEAAAAAAAAKAQADAEAAAAAAAQAEEQRQAAAIRAAQAAETKRLAELRAAAEAEAARIKDAEAAALKAAEEGAKKEKEMADAIANDHAARSNQANSSSTASDEKTKAAKEHSDDAIASAEKADAAAKAAEKAAEKAAKGASDAEAAEQALQNAQSNEERNIQLEKLNQAGKDASDGADEAKGHADKAKKDKEDADESVGQAKKKLDELPPPTPEVTRYMTSRNWLLCGGGYSGWTGPGLCASVSLEATTTGTVSTVVMKLRNLSGLFQSYAASIITGIGLTDIMGGNPTNLVSVEGPCVPTNQDCERQWSLATGTSKAKMPNGIGPVDYKLLTRGLPGGVASSCGTAEPVESQGVGTPRNPNGLYTTGCDRNFDYSVIPPDFVTFTFTTLAPVDFTNTEVSLRAQNGYHGGSTACITSGRENDQNAYNDCIDHTTVTPEPATMVLMGSGLLTVFGMAARRRKKATDATA